VLSQRFCTQFRLSATAPDPGKPPTTVSLRVGHFGTDGTVIYAKGDVTGPEGETLSTGDPLCTGENGARYPITDESNSVYVLDTSLEHDLKLHVGSDGALWFGIGTFGPASPPLTGGVIDVPAAHINVIGAIAARRLVLGLGNGQTVTLQPPETAPADLYPADEANPVAGKGDPNNLEKITKNPERGGPFTGFVAIIPTREVIAGATQFNRAFFGANGSVDFQGGIPGFGLGDPLGGLRPSNGAVIARGNITVSGPIDLETDNVVAFVSLGTVSLLGT
jgi:hypothetical protein